MQTGKKDLKKFDKKFWAASLATFICWILPGCRPDEEIIIQEKVTERVNAFRVKKNAECNALLWNEAEKIVDSLLLEAAETELRDSLLRLRPSRPTKPAPLLPVDSLEVAPLFEQASSTRQEGGK